MYQPPSWCLPDNRWRFSLGYLLRFILSAKPDFTRVVRPLHWKDAIPCYRPPENHWYQRRYGLFNGQGAFGDDWLPISNWIEQFISALLGWPGCRTPNQFEWVRGDIEDARANIGIRTRELTAIQGSTRSVLMLQLTAPMVEKRSTPRPLRACVVQTVIPNIDHLLPNDLTCSQSGIRRSHRNHLSAALAAVNRLLDLRETHKGRDGRLDWLILPELSVHPRDIVTHLVPFARRHRAIILAGLTYEKLFSGQPLVNSAVWVIPVWSAREGLQIRIHRQGKHHLSPGEESLNSNGVVIQGFRPCQWLVGYEWTCKKDERPLWLSASICYDATDIRLASDLRHQSDVFAIPALNKDVNTFDQMAQALHYHMFQLVIVANNGRYGGSNAYAPYYEPYERQVFHLHGQPQASISFLEIDDIQAFLSRKSDAKVQLLQQTSPNAIPPVIKWKYPPAGI
jgi:hypothetical protein